jgi:hypothetical protein
MNAIKCPNCGHLNGVGENFCMQCGRAFAALPSSAQVSLSPEQHAAAYGFAGAPANFVDVERGRKVFFWYKIYAVFMALLYAGVAAMGGLILVFGAQARGKDATDAMIAGPVYLVIGAILFVPFAVAPFLSKKPWHWIYHIVLICIGLTSCCFMPVTIPLLINWLKPETKAIFGRK